MGPRSRAPSGTVDAPRAHIQSTSWGPWESDPIDWATNIKKYTFFWEVRKWEPEMLS